MVVKKDTKLQSDVTDNVTNSPVNQGGEIPTPTFLTEDIVGPREEIKEEPRAFTEEQVGRLTQAEEQFGRERVKQFIEESGGEEEFITRGQATVKERQAAEEEAKKEEAPEVTPVEEEVVEEPTDRELIDAERERIRDLDTDFETKRRLLREFNESLKSGVPAPKGPEPEEIPEEVPEDVPEKSNEQSFAEQNSIKFKKNDDGTITFTPTDVEEAIDLALEFGPNVKISKGTKEAITGSKLFQKYSKYKGASSDVYLQGFKDNEIGVGGETWERLKKMNGGQPTAEMLQAQEEFEAEIKINNVNTTSNIASGKEVEKQTNVNKTTLTELDTAYVKSVQSLFGQLTTNWTKLKSGNKKLEGLNNDLSENAARRDELQLEKRNVLKRVQRDNPSLTLGQQLNIADRELDAIDDRLFSLQREYNSDLSAYKFENEKTKGEFEFQAGLVEQKLKITDSLYGIQRADIIRQDQVTRQDTLIANQITRDEKKLAEAIKQKDGELAKKIAHDIALVELKGKINKDNQDKFSTANLGKGAVLKLNKQTGEYEVIKEEGAPGVPGVTTIGGQTFETGNTSTIPRLQNTGNVAEDLNNPANLTVGGTGDQFSIGTSTVTGKDGITREFLVFQNSEQGFKAMSADISSKQAGKTTTGLSGTSTLDELSDVWVGGDGAGEGYKNTVSRELNLPRDTQIGDLDSLDVAKALSVAEGFKGGNDLYEKQTVTTPTVPGETTLTEDALVFNIGKSIFGSKISDTEGDKVADFVAKGTAEGLDTDAIIDEILFFKPTDNKELGQSFKDVLVANNINLNDFDLRRLGTLLSENKLSQAVRKIEDGVLSKERTKDPDGFVSERLTRTMVRRADELNGFIEELSNTKEGKKNPIGTETGTIEEWLGRFKSTEAVGIKNRATRLVSDFRLKNLGSAVTETESAFLDGVIPELFDSTENFVVKVTQFKDQALGEINDFRGILELPALTTESLIDKELRARDYVGITEETREAAAELGTAGVALGASIGFDYISEVTPNTKQTAVDSYLDSLKLTK